MEKATLRLEASIVVGGFRLTPVSRLTLHTWRHRRAATALGMKYAAAVLVSSAAGTRAFRYSGEEISIQELVREMPAISADLERLARG